MGQSKPKGVLLQVARYFVAGGAFFWSGYAAFALFDGIFHWPLILAKPLANGIGLTVNYILEDLWVFKSAKHQRSSQQRGGRYLGLTAANFVIDYLIVAGLKQAGLTPYLGQFVSAGFFTLWNFVWYKYWVFAPHVSKRRRGATL